MKITEQQAFELAKKTKENGCCSQYGQTIVILLAHIEKLETEKQQGEQNEH